MPLLYTNQQGGDFMNLQELYYLIAVAETNSMHLAAERLHVSQQNVSRVLKKLENELQIQLFHKSNLGSQLTSEGELVYNSALKIVSELHSLMSQLKPSPLDTAYLNGTVDILCSNSIAGVADNFIFSFQKEQPNVIFSLHETTTKGCLFHFDKDAPPILFVQLPIDKLLHNKDVLSLYYESYLLSSEALKLIIHKDNPLAKQSSISLNRLSSIPFAMRSSSINNLPEHVQTILDIGIPLDIKFVSTSDTSLTRYLKHNQACSLSTNINIKYHKNDLVALPIRERIYVALCVLFPKNANSATKHFSKHILDSTSEYAQKLF